MIGDLERDRRAPEDELDREDLRGTPGRTTLTSRLPPTTRSIARAVVQLMQVHAKGDLDGPDVHAVASHGMTGAGGTLPFLDQIQRAFGHHDIGGVRAHIGGSAGEASEALGARAYASGDAVAFASAPDLHLAAHEAAHVVQQRGGVRLSGGVGRAGDEYEINADAVADRVVRGESAQDLLDPFSHRGSSGGPAVQRQEHDESSAGVQDFNRMLLRGAPTPRQIVACMRRHSGDARAILARVRERLGEVVALSVEVEVSATAPELVPVLGSPRAHGTSPVRTEEARPDAVAGGPEPRPREGGGSPVDLHAEGDSVSATVHPDAHSTVEATVAPGEAHPILRDVRVVISDSTRGGGASGEIEVGADLEDGRGHALISGELRPDGEDGPSLSGEASVSAGTGERGGVDVRGSGRVEIRVPVGDHAVLREALILTDDGHLRIEAGADLLRRVRGLPEGNAAREPLLRLFMTVDTDLATGERSVSGGGSLEVQFDRGGGDHDDPGEVHQLALSGTRGGGTSMPHLSQIQAAFGHHDITGVRAHVGGAAAAAAGALGARGYATGNDIAFAAAPDLHLAAHEAAHVVQQRGGVRLSGGVGRAGDDYEQHADAVADLVVRGESAQSLLDQRAHRGAAGGSALQLDEEADREWLSRLRRDANGHYTAADGRELSRGEQRRLRRVLGGGTARAPRAEMTDAVDQHERQESEHPEASIERTSIDEDREQAMEQTGTSRRRGVSYDPRDRARGGRGSSTQTLDDGTQARVEQIDETRSQLRSGVRVERTERGRRAHSDQDLARQLEQQLVELHQQEDAAPPSEWRTFRDRRRQLRSDIAQLDRHDISAEDRATIAQRHGLRVEPIREQDVTTETARRDYNPLDDGTVGSSSETVREVRELEGDSARVVEQSSTQVDLGAGAVERRRAEETTVRSADGSALTDRSSRTVRGEVGDGRATGTLTRRQEREDARADGTTEREATETSTSAGAIISEDETGGRVGRTSRTEAESGGTATARETSSAVELTDRRVGVSGSDAREVRRGSVTGTARVSTDGSFSIDVEPMDDGSGRSRLTFTIHVGVAGEASARRRRESGGGLRGSASVRGSAQGDLITSRVISEDEARSIMADADRVDRGGRAGGSPEFDRLARVIAAGEGADAMLQSGAVLGDAASARDMQDGDSITLDTQVGVGGDVSAGGSHGGFGGDIEAGGDARWRRTVQVERISVDGQPRVRLTVTYQDETEWHAGGSASLQGVGAARARHGEESGATDSVQFVIDPAARDYDQRYQSIVQTTDRTQLRALERRYAADVRRSRHAETSATDDTQQVGPTSSVMIGSHIRTSGTDDIAVEMDDAGNPVALEGVVEGGSDRDVSVRAGDHDIDIGGHAESVRGTIDRTHGTRVDIEAQEQQSDPLAALSDARDAIAEADGRERVAMAVAHTPAERLREAFQQFNHVWGYHLGEADLASMSERAGDSQNWSACCIVPDAGVLAAWSRLRVALARPRPDAAEARVDPEGALNLARVRALTAWMRSANGRGAQCLERVLRRWGESMTHEVSSERLGDGYEWPTSLREAHSSYTRLVTQAEGLRDRLEQALARPAGNTEAQTHFASVSSGFDTVLRQVRACGDFRSEARRSEMILEIENHRADIHVVYRDFQRRWGELHVLECSEQQPTGPDAPTAAEIDGTRSSVADRSAERRRARERAAIRVLEGNHARETRLLQQVQAILRDLPANPQFGVRRRAEAVALCTQVHDLHRTWIQQVQDLRVLYSNVEAPPSTWRVSTGPGAPRTRELEPNVGWLVIEYRLANSDGRDVTAAGRAEQWSEEGREY